MMSKSKKEHVRIPTNTFSKSTLPPFQATLWPDQWLSRRKRVHILEDASGAQVAARTYFIDILDDAINLGLTELLVHGKTHKYRLTITHLNTS